LGIQAGQLICENIGQCQGVKNEGREKGENKKENGRKRKDKEKIKS
jgi:hypothetical protein